MHITVGRSDTGKVKHLCPTNGMYYATSLCGGALIDAQKRETVEVNTRAEYWDAVTCVNCKATIASQEYAASLDDRTPTAREPTPEPEGEDTEPTPAERIHTLRFHIHGWLDVEADQYMDIDALRDILEQFTSFGEAYITRVETNPED